MNQQVRYIGCDDRDLTLFESQYELPEGMCYNSYLLLGDKIAVLDSVDSRKTDEWLRNLANALNGAKPDYIVIHHMEPDHSGSLRAFLTAYPAAQVVCSDKALKLASQFACLPEGAKEARIVKEGDVLDLGTLSLRFMAAPMVHWPEVMVSYCEEIRTLFSADAFGKFGVYNADADDWACEARRYYFNICGKYGMPVSRLMAKVAPLAIDTICPLHGPVLEGELKDEAIRLYSIWSAYGIETPGVLIACASIHGNTLAAAEKLAEMLRERGAGRVELTDLCRDDMAEAIEDAFRMDRLILCASSYDNNVFPPMHQFLWKLQQKGFQNRRVGIVENGSWAPSAGREMKALLAGMQNITLVEPMVTILSSLNPASEAQLIALADAMAK